MKRKLGMGLFSFHTDILEAINNFGLGKFGSEKWVVKIDGDQVYFKERLHKLIKTIRKEKADNLFYGFRGYNTVIWRNRLVFMSNRINGGYDHFIVKRKFIKKFVQTNYYEHLKVKKISAIKWPTDYIGFTSGK